MCPVGQVVRQRSVANGPAVRFSDSFELPMTMACRASGSLGDRCTRRGGECHKEQTDRTGDEEAQAAQERRAATARSCPPPR